MKPGGFTVGFITATMALLVREEDLVVSDKEKLLLNDAVFRRAECLWRRGRECSKRSIISLYERKRKEVQINKGEKIHLVVR